MHAAEITLKTTRRLNTAEIAVMVMVATDMPFGPARVEHVEDDQHVGRLRVTFGGRDYSKEVFELQNRGLVRFEYDASQLSRIKEHKLVLTKGGERSVKGFL